MDSQLLNKKKYKSNGNYVSDIHHEFLISKEMSYLVQG